MEAPEKIFRWIGADRCVNYTPCLGVASSDAERTTYIREDLHKPLQLLPEPGKLEASEREELFKQVAVRNMHEGHLERAHLPDIGTEPRFKPEALRTFTNLTEAILSSAKEFGAKE